jgi:putative ABC transport system substrate-binding protein
MNRRTALRNLATIFLTTASLAQAQQAKKIPLIGYISNTDSATESSRADGIRLALSERGYIDGKNISIEYRYAEGKVDRFSALAADMVRRKIDIIVVAGGPIWVQAAKDTTKTIPIVMVGTGSDPVEAGLIDGLARPGGNVTGLTNLGTELGGKRLELLKEAVPKIAHVAFLYVPAAPATVLELKEVQAAAPALRLTIRPWELRATDDFEKVFAALNKQRPDGLYVPAGPLLRANVKRTAGFALKSRIPSVGNVTYVNAGGLIAYSADVAESYRRVAYYVDRILKGTKPADLPVEQPMKFEFVINLETAKKIGVTIPQSVLFRATRVIQ